MHPILFNVGPWPVYSYGVLLAASYLAGLWMAVARARRAGVDSGRVLDLGIYLIIAALVGAKLMLVLVDVRYFANEPGEMLSLVRAGGIFYGGLIAAGGTAWMMAGRYGLPLWTTADLVAPAVAFGHMIGRVGCLLAGCCYGRPTAVPWAVTFTDPVAAANVGTPLDVPLHPTQLYDGGVELLILIVLLAIERKGAGFAGRTFSLYILLYASARFFVEFYRGDERGMLAGLSTSQVVSLAMVPIAVLMWRRLRVREHEPAPGLA